VFQFFKISFKQIFSNSPKSKSKFIVYFGIVSLSICLSALALAVCLSNGFKKEIYLRLSSIDGHYRINDFDYLSKENSLSYDSILEIKETLNKDSLFVSYSAYTENYVLANIFGESEGLLVYGVDRNEVSNIFDIYIPYKKKEENIIPISIGKKLAEAHRLKIGDVFFIFPFDINKTGALPDAAKVIVSNIFNSGFSEYDKAVCFMDLTSSRFLFNYGLNASGIIGTVNNPLNINNQFDSFFSNINQFKYRITTWFDRHKSISSWLSVYSEPILFIIFLIIVLAMFNMSLSVWILMQDKLKEISILFTLGLTKRKIAFIAIIQNMILTSISILIASGASFLLLFIQNKYRVIKLSQEIYFIDYLPVEFSYLAVAKYFAFFFLFSMFASLIPAFKLYSINIIKHISSND